MSSLVDKFRSTPPRTRTVYVFGGDPDMDTTGWSMLRAEITTPATSKPVITNASIGLIIPQQRGLHDLEQADEMVRAVMHFPCPCSPFTAAFIEAQQVYPNQNEDPRTKVAKANDLLRCAQVTGALQAWAVAKGATVVRSLLPATWKGQNDKHVTQATLTERLAQVPIKVLAPIRGHGDEQTIHGAQISALPVKLNHALDALGLAVYGLDLLSRHLELLPV
jgi:hypothetical protein